MDLADFSPIALVATTDPARARTFYEEDARTPVLGGRGLRAHVRLRRRAAADRPRGGVQPQPFTVLSWRVDDIETTVETLSGRGVTFERYPRLEQDLLGVWTSPSGARVAWFKDPDGNTLSLTQFAD
jgi:catechol 2,3-dioxygenase-like lactoylglutathione lyase family enzyme